MIGPPREPRDRERLLQRLRRHAAYRGRDRGRSTLYIYIYTSIYIYIYIYIIGRPALGPRQEQQARVRGLLRARDS